MKLQLKTLSPIHIGNGDTLKSLSYVKDSSFIYIVNMGGLFEKIKGIGKTEDYLKWIEPILNQLSAVDDKLEKARDNFELKRDINRQRRELEAQLSLEWFIRNRLRKEPVEFVKDCSVYKVPFSSPPQRDGFKTFIKNGTGQAYIPGTEIKGAIRTASLYSMLQDKGNYNILKSEVEKFKNVFKGSSPTKEKIKVLEKISGEVEGRLLRGNENKSYFDLFKHILVSDSAPIPFDMLKIETAQMIGTERYTKTWVETVVSGTELDFELSINRKTDLKKLGIERFEDWFNEEKLLEACYYRSNEILELESRYFSKSQLLSTIDKLKNLNKKNSPLIRLGAGQGFLGVTVDLIMLKNKDDQLYEIIREGVSFQRRWRTQRGKFPKTRRIVIDKNGKEITLMGWAKISKKDVE